MTATTIVWLDELRASDIPRAGGKLARLGELASAGFDVPRGFVVPVEALAAALPVDVGNAIECEIREAPQGLEAMSRVAAGARARLEGLPFPEVLRAAILDAYERLGDGNDVRTAVRSSGVREDGETASFAGQFDTYLGVSGGEAVVRAVQRCWASQYTDRALDYCRRKGLTTGAQGMAVGVLEMVSARVSGIAMTVDPTTGRRDHAVIEASWGLGESLVSGQVTPDRWVIEKATRRIVEATVATKEVWSIFDEEAGAVISAPVPDDLRDKVCLSDEELDQVLAAAVAIEQREGLPQDIEWALAEHESGGWGLVLLQHRPETTVGATQQPFDPVAYTLHTVLGVRGTGPDA